MASTFCVVRSCCNSTVARGVADPAAAAKADTEIDSQKVRHRKQGKANGSDPDLAKGLTQKPSVAVDHVSRTSELAGAALDAGIKRDLGLP